MEIAGDKKGLRRGERVVGPKSSLFVGGSRCAAAATNVPVATFIEERLSYNAQPSEDLMKRPLYIASGASVVVTTVTYARTMYGTMAHLVTHHGQGFSHPFFALHSMFAAVPGVLSLVGAYFLLTGWRQQNPS